MKKFAKTMAVLAAGAAMIGAAGTASAQNGTNPEMMTWGTYDIANSTYPNQVTAFQALRAAHPDVTVVGCKNCDPYQGDRPETQNLRILCVVPGNNPEPAEYAAVFDWMPLTDSASKNWKFYYGWFDGFVALTNPVSGLDITSRAVGDQKCKDFFAGQLDTAGNLKYPDAAANARMVEHHENGVGGWAIGAQIHPGTAAKGQLKHGMWSGVRFIASINNQPANPWD